MLIFINRCSIFPECCLQNFKRTEWSKSFLVKTPPPVNPLAKFPAPLPLNAIWKTAIFRLNFPFLVKMVFISHAALLLQT